MNEANNIEARLDTLERLLLVSLDGLPYCRRTDAPINDLNEQLDTLQKDVEDCSSQVFDLQDQIEELERLDISQDEITRRIQKYIKIHLRSALGLEVSADDKRQT